MSRLFALILLMTPLSGMAIDIYTPSMPAIMNHFETDKAHVQLTITFYLLAYGSFQVICGTLADFFDAKRVLIGGLALFAFSTLLIPLAPNIGTILLLRFIQGATVSAPGAISKTLLSRNFTGIQLRRYSTYMTMGWALGPVIAPAIGGYLQHFFDWQAPFILLGLFASFILFCVFLWLPNIPATVQQRNLNQLILSYKEVVAHRPFWGSILCCALVYGIMITFNVMGPFLVQSALGYSPVVFGYLAMLMGATWLLGNISNRFFIEKYKIDRILFYAIVSLIILMGFSWLTTLFVFDLWTVVLPTAIALYLGAVILTNSIASCLGFFPHKAGIASGLMGSSFAFGAGLISFLATLVHAQTAMPLTVIYLVISVLAGVCYYILLARE